MNVKFFTPLYVFTIFIFTAFTACSLTLPSKYTPDGGSNDDASDDRIDVDVNGDDGPGPCPDGWIRCEGDCVDPLSDPLNCGTCRNACPPDKVCREGICACADFLTDCGGTCVDTNSNPRHCGGCGNACPEGWVCESGICKMECSEGLTNCSGACVDLTSDPLNCGSCGNVCPPAVGADPVCYDSACYLECQENRWDLDGAPGCEYECVPTSDTEICDGMDNDCNGIRDEGFDCVMGTMVLCTTTCNTDGTGICTHTCEFPTGDQCNPPEEICNGEDEDCDGVSDNGFECPMGVGQTCRTECGTEGFRECGSTCTWSPCCAGSETCGNGCDDNCNGAVDEGCPDGPPNDTCDNPLDVSSSGRFHGNTTGAEDNSWGWCSFISIGGGDVVFSFTVTTSSDVFISTFGTGFDTVIYAGSTCGESDLGCWDDFSGEITQSYLRLEDLAAGTYYITLDGKNPADFGEYILDVYISAHDDYGDKCGRPLRFVAPDESGNTCGYDDDNSGSCGSITDMDTPERVYFFIVSGASPSRTVTFSTCNAGTDYDSLMFIRSVCNDPLSEEVCNDDAGAACSSPIRSMLDATLSPGIYYLFIDAYGNNIGECGNYSITSTGL